MSENNSNDRFQELLILLSEIRDMATHHGYDCGHSGIHARAREAITLLKAEMRTQGYLNHDA